MFNSILGAIRRLWSESKIRFQTGIQPIDRVSQGMSAGDTCVILGHDTSGKTVVALHIMSEWLRSHRILYIGFGREAIEMARDRSARTLCDLYPKPAINIEAENVAPLDSALMPHGSIRFLDGASLVDHEDPMAWYERLNDQMKAWEGYGWNLPDCIIVDDAQYLKPRIVTDLQEGGVYIGKLNKDVYMHEIVKLEDRLQEFCREHGLVGAFTFNTFDIQFVNWLKKTSILASLSVIPSEDPLQTRIRIRAISSCHRQTSLSAQDCFDVGFMVVSRFDDSVVQSRANDQQSPLGS